MCSSNGTRITEDAGYSEISRHSQNTNLNVVLDFREEVISQGVRYFAPHKLDFTVLIRCRIDDKREQFNVMQEQVECCFHNHRVNDTLFAFVHIMFNH